MMYFKTKVFYHLGKIQTSRRSIEDAKKEFYLKPSAEAGEEMTDLQAEAAVARVLKTARLPKGIRMDKPSDAIFEVPRNFLLIELH